MWHAAQKDTAMLIMKNNLVKKQVGKNQQLLYNKHMKTTRRRMMTIRELIEELQARLEYDPECADLAVNGLHEIIIQDSNGRDFYVCLEAAE
jgi:hypothetical protein